LNRVRRLRMVEYGAFVNLTSLRRLELSQNRHLRYISHSAFVDVPVLTSLDLALSGLNTLESEVPGSLPALRKLSLRGSPLICDCIVRSLLRYFQNRANLTVDIDEGTVCSPPSFSMPTTTPASERSSANSSDSITSTVTADNSVAWRSATTDVVLNSTKTPAKMSEPVQNNRTVSALCRPRILALFNSDVHVTVTDKLRLDCRAVGIPPPSVSWLLPVDNDVIDDVNNDVSGISTSYGTQVINYFSPPSLTCMAGVLSSPPFVCLFVNGKPRNVMWKNCPEIQRIDRLLTRKELKKLWTARVRVMDSPPLVN